MVDCFIRVPGGEVKNLAVFNMLREQQSAVEARFGGTLDWQELPGSQGCRVCTHLHGGWKSREVDWPDMQDRIIDALVRLEHALKKPILELPL